MLLANWVNLQMFVRLLGVYIFGTIYNILVCSIHLFSASLHSWMAANCLQLTISTLSGIPTWKVFGFCSCGDSTCKLKTWIWCIVAHCCVLWSGATGMAKISESGRKSADMVEEIEKCRNVERKEQTAPCGFASTELHMWQFESGPRCIYIYTKEIDLIRQGYWFKTHWLTCFLNAQVGGIKP